MHQSADAITQTLVEKGIPADKHEDWVWGYTRMLAGKFAESLGFHKGGQEHDELQSAAYLVVCADVVPGFDPEQVKDGNVERVWKQYLKTHVKGEVGREARRLRNGGTYNTRHESDHEPINVEGLPYRRDAGDDIAEVAIADEIDGEPLDQLIEEEGAELNEERWALLLRMGKSLTPDERRAVTLRFGVGGSQPVPIELMGRDLAGRNPEQVKTLLRRALRKLGVPGEEIEDTVNLRNPREPIGDDRHRRPSTIQDEPDPGFDNAVRAMEDAA